jgi:branched-chain amino acid transport system substrate-binding protein
MNAGTGKWKVLRGIAMTCVCTGLLAFLVSCTANPADVQIGGVYALTGKAASFGNEVKNGSDLAVGEINEGGGIKGRMIRVISEDTQSDAKTAVAVLEKLIAVNKISVAVGFITSSEAMSCAPVAERSRVVMITPIAGTPDLKDAGDFIFRTRESGVEQSHIVAEYMVKTLGIKEAALLCENAANAVGYRAAFMERFKDIGGTVIANLSYDEGQTDFRLVLTELKAKYPKAVYMPGVGKVLGRVLKQMRELGIEAQVFSSAGIEDPELFRMAGDAANGVIYGAPAFSTGSEEPATKAFVQAYKAKFGEAPTVYSANAYDALMLVAIAMRSGHLTAEGIRDSLYATRDYPGASGKITFDKFGEVSKPVILKCTGSGVFEPIP